MVIPQSFLGLYLGTEVTDLRDDVGSYAEKKATATSNRDVSLKNAVFLERSTTSGENASTHDGNKTGHWRLFVPGHV